MYFCGLFAADGAESDESEAIAPQPDLQGWKTTVQPFIMKHCTACHGAEKQKGDLNLEEFTGNILGVAEAGMWQEIVGVLNAGEMPPPKEPRPPVEDLLKTIEWIQGELAKAGQLVRAQGPGMRLRRPDESRVPEHRPRFGRASF